MDTMILWAATGATEPGLSMWGMVVKGGWLMVPIFALSVIAVYIFCERFVALRKAGKADAELPSRVRACMQAGDWRGAEQACHEAGTPLARVIAKGIQYKGLPAAELRAVMESTATLEVAAMEKGLNTLATCAGMAPMIGFLGTVVGMIQAFYDMALAGSNINITLLSRGIYTAMVTTVAGLIVGIIAYFANNALTGRIDAVANRMDAAIAEVMEAVYAGAAR